MYGCNLEKKMKMVLTQRHMPLHSLKGQHIDRDDKLIRKQTLYLAILKIHFGSFVNRNQLESNAKSTTLTHFLHLFEK